ncbi:MAG: M20/M25/M40 family metallo-hydrolase [Myxococcota bacterium]|jgi:glutamate carboxypeptidase|nr:M20/M25/M40 family metallo-hydrolase [Myxococcota bacterium]
MDHTNKFIQRGTEVLAFALQQERPWLELLESLVSINSHASNPEGLRACGDLIALRLAQYGFETRLEEVEKGGLRLPHLVATRAAAQANAPTILLLGHLDTVFPKDHPFSALRKEQNRWIGPGVSDMKGGLVTALFCLELLHHFGVLPALDLRVVFVADEETSAPTGHLVLEQASRGADIALSFEAARPDGDLVVERKGLGLTRVRVLGKTGHAGIDHDTAINAFSALCDFICGAESLEREIEGVTLSPGGAVHIEPQQLNAVPALAVCELEWRFLDANKGQEMIARLDALGRDLERRTGARVQLTSAIDTPPMPEHPASTSLLQLYQDAARALGFEVRGARTAGVGDINYVAGFGLACLDGLGPVGGGFHSEEEYVLPHTIALRAGLSAMALLTLAERPTQPQRES